MAGFGAAGGGDVRRVGSAGRCACAAVLALAIYATGERMAAADWFFPTPRTGRADIAGRWVLRTPSQTYCVVDFSGSPATFSGTITATGFCPRPFLGRPQWRYQDGRVVIKGRNGALMADLTVDGRNLLAGQMATGEGVWLNR